MAEDGDLLKKLQEALSFRGRRDRALAQKPRREEAKRYKAFVTDDVAKNDYSEAHKTLRFLIRTMGFTGQQGDGLAGETLARIAGHYDVNIGDLIDAINDKDPEAALKRLLHESNDPS